MSEITTNEGLFQTDEVGAYAFRYWEQANGMRRPSMHHSLLLSHGKVLRMLN
jgi:hypothetical protein